MPSSLRALGFAVVILSGLVCSSTPLAADEAAAKVDARHPFRTDVANEHLPWYQPKPLEFPPLHSERRIEGELVSVDFIHRTGQFRTSPGGELVDFSMPSYGAINHLNAEADLRDVPLGGHFLFFLHQDADGGFTRLATMRDQFTLDSNDGVTYRLNEVKIADGRLLVTRHGIPKEQEDLGKRELHVTPQTRFWKADRQVALKDLAPGDELLFNVSQMFRSSDVTCSDIWVGAEAHQAATDQQRRKFIAFNKARGLPGWVEGTSGNQLVVTLFSGDARNFNRMWMDDFAAKKSAKVVVANDELRTWNPPVDNEHASIVEVRKFKTDRYGCSGVTLVLTVNNMLEGFRKGRIVRVFGSGWPLKDQLYGESLMGYGYGRMRTELLKENPPKEYPGQFPFRTDFGNTHLPWHQLKPDVAPPRFSEHLVLGQLVKADGATSTGQFRADRTGALVDFALIAQGKVRYVGADAGITDIPLGTRCRFHLYQDHQGAFRQASFISDEFSHLAQNAITWRIESLRLDEGRLDVAWQIPEVKNYNGDMERPADIGRGELRVTTATRVWRGGKLQPLTDLVIGDELLVNLTGEQSATPSHCTDIWVGVDTHQLVSAAQQKQHADALKKPKAGKP